MGNALDLLLSKQVKGKVFLIHRLDKEAGGILLVCKSAKSARVWNTLFRKRIKKEYQALCIGKMPKEEGVIDTPIVVKGVKKEALTNYKTLDTFSVRIGGEEFTISLLLLTIASGRQHQIRVHLSSNNCFIIGDTLHGNYKLNHELKKSYGIKGLHLSCTSLTLPLQEEGGKSKTFNIVDSDIKKSILLLKGRPL